jgi:hypothetical protein
MKVALASAKRADSANPDFDSKLRRSVILGGSNGFKLAAPIDVASSINVPQ